MARIASGAAEKVEQVAPAEAKRRALTKDLTGTLTAEERAAKTKELRALLANDPGDASHFTADEMATKSHSDVEAWASTMRSRYGLSSDLAAVCTSISHRSCVGATSRGSRGRVIGRQRSSGR